MKAVKTMLTSMTALFAASALAATYDATTGYATMINSDSSYSNVKAYRTYSGAEQYKDLPSNWSDGQRTHSGTNYYVSSCLATEDETFKGDSLTVGEKAWLRATSSFRVDDLRLLPNSSFNPMLGGGTQIASGTMHVFSTQANPFLIIGGKSGQTFDIAMKLIGDAESSIYAHAWNYFNNDGSTQHTGGPMKTACSGDNSEFFGTVRVSTNMVMDLKSDFEHAILKVEAPDSVLTTVANASSILKAKRVEVLAGKLAVAAANIFQVGDLVLGEGAALAGSGEVVVTNSLVVNGRVTLVIPADPRREFRLLSIPAEKGNFSLSDFRIETGNFRYDLFKRTENGTNSLVAVNLAPASLDASSGYVAVDVDALAENESSKTYAPVFTTASLWMDKSLPDDPTKDYFLGGGSTARSPSGHKFLGRSLTIGKGGPKNATTSIAELGLGYLEVEDLVLLENASAYYNGNPVCALVGRRMTVLSPNDPYQAFGLSNNNINPDRPTQHHFRYEDLRGGTNSMIRLSASQYCQSGMYFFFEGGQTNFYGTVRVEATEHTTLFFAMPNYALLGGTGLPQGTVLLAHTNAVVGTCGRDGQSVPLKRLTTGTTSARAEIAATNELAVGSAVLAGTLEKTGAGVLALGPVTASTAKADGRVHVAEGGFRALCAEPFDGTSLDLDDGTVYVRDIRDTALAERGMVMASGLTCAGNLKVRLAGVPDDKQSRTVALMTLPSAQADTLAAGRLSIERLRGYRATLVVGSENEGMKTLSANIEPQGLVVIVR